MILKMFPVMILTLNMTHHLLNIQKVKQGNSFTTNHDNYYLVYITVRARNNNSYYCPVKITLKESKLHITHTFQHYINIIFSFFISWVSCMKLNKSMFVVTSYTTVTTLTL